MINNQACL